MINANFNNGSLLMHWPKYYIVKEETNNPTRLPRLLPFQELQALYKV